MTVIDLVPNRILHQTFLTGSNFQFFAPASMNEVHDLVRNLLDYDLANPAEISPSSGGVKHPPRSFFYVPLREN
jgi:hypothetical protein